MPRVIRSFPALTKEFAIACMERTNQISPWSRTVDWTYNEHIVQRRVLSSSTVKSLKPIYLANPTCHLSPLSVSIDNDERTRRTLKAFKTSAVSFIFRFSIFSSCNSAYLVMEKRIWWKKKLKEFWDFTLGICLYCCHKNIEHAKLEYRYLVLASIINYI